MVYTPHTVTVYNASENTQTLMSEYNITILRGVFLDISKGSNVIKSGLESADAATLYIPFAIDAINGVSGEPQQYVSPKEYERLADKSGFWTIRPSGSGSSVDCFFTRGDVVDQAGFQSINARYDDVYRTSSVDIRDFGSADMQHFEVGGR